MPTNRHGITSNLLTPEVFWRDHYDYILEHGYKLRPRYRPDWVPSWKSWWSGTRAEDRPFLRNVRGATNDARRRTDNHARVVLKRADLAELDILRHLHSLPPSLQNHTVPLLDVVPLENPKEVLIVMPFLRGFHEPSFDRLDEVIHALLEIMRGIAFMHSHKIAHRDACLLNFVMDSTELIPTGFHFSASYLTPDMKRFIKPKRRFAVNIRYYIIDFETSLIRPGPGSARYRVGQDKTVPEFKSEEPYDPFKLDIYQVGNMIRKRFVERYAGLDVLAPIAEAMSRETPAERPTADQVVLSLEVLAKSHPAGPWIHLKDAEYWAKRKVQLRNKIREYSFFSCWGVID
ncbi:hypothetical protein GGX14DRAFT_612096 [Mycena pura]|uniref:Protein kinase domain-containing protein n=1 Tax=Mycena pura TaxID=153505 RepID=A0AAD6YSG5_9AGAR|nr:hypothetical protein GGX14DRAFT_612096 [Mycena pura]